MHGIRYRSFTALLGIRHPISHMVTAPCISDSSSTHSHIALQVHQKRFGLLNSTVHVADFLWQIYSLK